MMDSDNTDLPGFVRINRQYMAFDDRNHCIAERVLHVIEEDATK